MRAWRLAGFHRAGCTQSTRRALPNMRRTSLGLKQSPFLAISAPDRHADVRMNRCDAHKAK